MSNPKISVVIPTKNRIEELSRTIASVLNQSFQDFEVLIVDDHSEEDIQKFVESQNDDRIKYFKSDKTPSNANVCRNIGIKESIGEFVAMLDSDDEWLPDHLTSTLAYLENKECQGVFGSIIVEDGLSRKVAYSLPLLEGQKMINYILSGGNVQTSTHLYTRESALEIGWDESLFRHQDFDFAVRYHQRFNFLPIIEPSTIVHWKAGEKRTEHFESMMRFISINESNISALNYLNYHKNVLNRIKHRADISPEIKNHYKNEVLRFIQMISLNDYLLIFGNMKNALGRFYLRLEFIFKILIKR